MAMVECSETTFRVPISAASDMGISWSNQGVVTIRSSSPSSWPTAPVTMYPTQSMSRTWKAPPPSMETVTASSGTNLGSAVMMVRPEPLWGSSSRARSRRYTFSMLGMTMVSMNRLMKVDFPVRTGPTTPM